ncbi:MAG: adenylate/guanylate cyclase domain-containing protein [Candidatus Parcubacteria bacterium]|nr:adenylate/guanylate cyclase domain-containing protein [Burkholderiales bacterium]
MALVNGLMAQLDQAGARIDRLRFVSGTLHPQLLAWGAVWSRDSDAQILTADRGVQISDAYLNSPIKIVREQNRIYRRRLEAGLREEDYSLLHELRAEGMTDYLALPMVFNSGTVNFLAFATTAPGGFTEAELERLGALANLLAPLIEIIEARRMTLGLLNTFLGPRIGARILEGQVKRGDGERIEAAFWYSDLRGFTRLSETLPPAELLQLLNEYFENCAAAAAPRGGEILQFIGDAILIVFEIRLPEDEPAVCEDALDAAVDAFAAIAVVNHRRRRAGAPEIEFGLGLHLGNVTHANVGAPDRLAFNVIGPAVNKTARIQARTKDAGTPLLVSAEFAALVKRPLRSAGRFELRGVEGTHEVFSLAEGP